MKFGKNIGRVVELSDPEWSPFWMNYKFLKKKVKVGRAQLLPLRRIPLSFFAFFHYKVQNDIII